MHCRSVKKDHNVIFLPGEFCHRTLDTTELGES